MFQQLITYVLIFMLQARRNQWVSNFFYILSKLPYINICKITKIKSKRKLLWTYHK